MKPYLVLLLVMPLLLVGCAHQQNLIMLTPDNSGSAGALELSNEAGKAVIDASGQAVSLPGPNSRPEPSPLSEAERTKLFAEALSVQPLAPVSYALAFEFGADVLTQASRDMIPQILASIKERNSLDIKVIGHTDRVGEEAYNQALGLERAVLVRDVLIAQGVAAGAITALSYGEGDPLVPTADNVPEAQNRRVEVVVR